MYDRLPSFTPFNVSNDLMRFYFITIGFLHRRILYHEAVFASKANFRKKGTRATSTNAKDKMKYRLMVSHIC
jgi:hypothetical protein